MEIFFYSLAIPNVESTLLKRVYPKKYGLSVFLKMQYPEKLL